MNQQSNRTSRRSGWRVWLSAVFAAMGVALLFAHHGTAEEAKHERPADRRADARAGAKADPQDNVPRVWISRDVPPSGQDDPRTPEELYFKPFWLFPESRVTKIQVNEAFPANRLDGDAQGTCVEMVFTLSGANDWVGAGWMAGDHIGDKPPLNLAEKLLVGFDRPVYLKFRARTKAKETVRVHFEAFGFASGDTTDGIRPAQTPQPQVTTLTDKWQTITIDLTKKAAGLEAVVCPLKVIAKADDNPRRDEVTAYVDDLRIEVGPPSKK